MERPLRALRQDGLLGKVGCGQLEMVSSELKDSGTHRAGSDDSQVPGSSNCEVHLTLRLSRFAPLFPASRFQPPPPLP